MNLKKMALAALRTQVERLQAEHGALLELEKVRANGRLASISQLEDALKMAEALPDVGPVMAPEAPEAPEAPKAQPEPWSLDATEDAAAALDENRKGQAIARESDRPVGGFAAIVRERQGG